MCVCVCVFDADYRSVYVLMNGSHIYPPDLAFRDVDRWLFFFFNYGWTVGNLGGYIKKA